MAQKVQVLLLDDLDGGTADETVEFGLDGTSYEIDLSEANAEKMRSALDHWVDHARRTGGRRGRVIARSKPRAATPTATTAVTPQATKATTSAPAASNGKADAPVDNQAVRAWARAHRIRVSDRGRIPAEVVQKYRDAGN